MSQTESPRWRIRRVHENRCALLPQFDCGKLASREGLPVEIYTHKSKSKVFAKATNGNIHFSGCIPLSGSTTYLAVEDVETDHPTVSSKTKPRILTFGRTFSILGDVELIPAYKLPMRKCIEQTNTRAKDERSFGERYEDFTKNFGTKTLQNIIKSRERLQVSQTSAVASASETLNETIVEERAAPAPVPEDTVEFPQRNAEFTSAKGVYSVHEVFSRIDAECFDNYAANNWAFEVVNKDKLIEWAANDTYSKYVLQRLGQVSKNENLRKMQLRCLAAYDIFTYIYKMKVRELRSRDPMPRVEEPYKTQIMDVFSRVIMDGKGRGLRTISMKAKDKLVAHCLLLQLLLEDFRVDLSLLQNDVKAATTRLTNVAFMLGCHVLQGRSPSGITTRTVVLKLPLYQYKGEGGRRKSRSGK
ncbi:DNA-directed RNA polymerase I subunit RPA49-like [Tropilaelaps mercedesae]|uniref:DNA-directed RNA polymerase I subunit RPA49-like n=1 Tax=Tropilaelaps mercedesae TaxID=418985 RepID=A0A1V9XAT2_9ACAR|nr:DNA-directed RNA polymerase I subunit RPA49-like [Tropilaelaps mercedesae]